MEPAPPHHGLARYRASGLPPPPAHGTTAAAAILAAANASRALKRFFSETKGADGGEGDDHTVAAAYLLLSHRVPALNLKGPEMAVAALRAVYAVHENA